MLIYSAFEEEKNELLELQQSHEENQRAVVGILLVEEKKNQENLKKYGGKERNIYMSKDLATLGNLRAHQGTLHKCPTHTHKIKAARLRYYCKGINPIATSDLI